jgi:DNA (cytosine-5)-methyltransferase 1
MQRECSLRVLDLFSGIGGFSLGLERAGMRTVQFCEINPFSRSILAKHWPDVPCHDDIRTFQPGTADVICGGFPCQDISNAGKRVGITGERSGLWGEFARVIRSVRPRYVIVENVAALNFRGLGSVLGDLSEIGYDAEWHVIPASAIGAPHERERCWIIAYPADLARLYQPDIAKEAQRLLDDAPAWATCPWDAPAATVCRMDDGISDRVDRTSALGNAVVPQIPEIIGRAIMKACSTAQSEPRCAVVGLECAIQSV